MDYNILDIIKDLELKTADFYKKVKAVSRFRPFSETFQLMETVSLNHAKMIEDAGAKFTRPNFDVTLIYNLHNQVNTLLWKEIVNETDENVILERIAKAEENIGKLYKSISNYFKALSAYYKDIGTFVEIISGEEFDHSKAILKLKK